MRYIDRAKLVKPAGWVARAQAASQAVADGEDPNDHSAVWRDLKNGLADLLHDKCWYCESPVDRSDNAVDHFRPKNRVSDAGRPHTGYRWLAFDVNNFRYACTYCNSRRIDVDGDTAGGKADRFPLIDEAQRVYVAGPFPPRGHCYSTHVKLQIGAPWVAIRRMVSHAQLVAISSPNGGPKPLSRFTISTTNPLASAVTPPLFS